jgi:6-phosphogluconolactonase
VNVSSDPWGAVAALLRETAERGGHIALSGGSTPRRAYEQAADADWSRATVWIVDERVVPPDDERSNFRLLRETLGDVDIRRVPTELGAQEAAARYDAELEGVTLDLAVLGMGPDGHTASLFPGRPELDVTDRRVVAVPEAGMEPYVPRVTMTFPTLAAARRRVFLVAGADKRETLRRVSELPAGRLDAEWFVDEAAAA